METVTGVQHEIEHWPIERLRPNPRNPRIHEPEQIEQLAQVIRHFGWTYPVLVDEDGLILAGHGRREAAMLLGLAAVPVLVARGWSEDQKRAYALADNRLNELSRWNDELLRLELGSLQSAQFDLGLTGFTGDALEAALRNPDADPDDADRGTLLQLVNITIADPTHVVERGDHYRLGGRHHLLCAGVISQWPLWKPLLTDGALFCPYPGVFVPFGSKAVAHTLVMVQPDPYIAGHILDRYCEVHGEQAAARVAAVA
jgi:hypothetical protein